jgi:hypothetical protein
VRIERSTHTHTHIQYTSLVSVKSIATYLWSNVQMYVQQVHVWSQKHQHVCQDAYKKDKVGGGRGRETYND